MLELRDQLRKARLDEERASNQLHKSKSRVAKLEVEIASHRDNAINEFVTSGGQESSTADQQSKTNGFNPMSPMPATMSMAFATGSGSEVVAKLNTQLIQVPPPPKMVIFPKNHANTKKLNAKMSSN